MKQSRLWRVGASCLNLNVRRAARSLTALYDESLRPVGLRITQFSALTAAGARPGASIADLARELGTDRTTMQRNLDVLERDGLISIADAKGGNLRQVTLTTAGQAKLREALPLWEAVQKKLHRRVGRRRARELIGLLASLGTE